MTAGPPPPPRSRRSADRHGADDRGRAVRTDERPAGRHSSDQVARDGSGGAPRHGAPQGGRHGSGEQPRPGGPRHGRPGSFADVVRAESDAAGDGASGAAGGPADGGQRRAPQPPPARGPQPGTGVHGTAKVGMRVRGGTVPRDPGTPAPDGPRRGAPAPGAREPVAPRRPAVPRPSRPHDSSFPPGGPAPVRPHDSPPPGGPAPVRPHDSPPAGGPPPVRPHDPATAAAPPPAAPHDAVPPGAPAPARRGERPLAGEAGGAGSDAAPRPGRRRRPEPPPSGPVTTVVPPVEPDDAPEPVTALAPAVAPAAGPETPGEPTPAARGPVGRALAFADPVVGPVRRRLGILDAEQKAALSPEQRRTRRRKQIRWTLVSGAASVFLVPLLVLGIGWIAFPIPSTDEAVQNQIATVSFADGGQLARLVPEQGNRIKVGMEAIPPHVREAVLAAEDRSFYSNPGFDITGILRAAMNQVLGGVGGGSTITQQFVKTTLVGNDATYWRKYKELIVALKVSGQKSKDEILNDYLNAIYFGRGAYGIESASLAYFGKPAAQLTPSDGALLAGVIQSPSNWDPANAPEKARDRWNFVLGGMVQQGWLTPEERAAAVFPQTIPPENTSRSSSLGDERGHILNAVRSELGALGISEQAFAQGGLQVTTTITPERQQELTDAVRAGMDGQPDLLRSAAVAVDPQTGGIVGYYGGANGTGLDYAKVMKQPGSTFKPFAVLAGLLEDPPVGLGTEFDGSEREGLRNADGANCQRCDIKQAMTISNNVVFTKLAAQVGPQKVADAARLAGITAPMENPDARLPLGNKEVTPVQLASAYATIAAGGVWHAPHLVSKVVDSEGRVLYEYSPGEGEQRFDEQVARNVTEAMMDVATNDDLELPGGQEVAAKTGTVQSRFEGQNNDAWFAGFTPGIATAVWVGTDRNDPIQNASGDPINGKDLPGEVWQGFMADAVRGGDTVEFPTFRPLGDAPSELAANEPTAPPTPTATATTAPPPPEPPEQPPPAEAPAAPTGTPEPDPGLDPLRAPDEDQPPENDEDRAAEPTFG
ncbi:transglycosylase domain-containing protein [Pseudonocardia sp. HH130630-07]|uniref:transglycosylase domain-containing protein n=1 Tax=Pseudonocardia sp. HH130630-07 TaxID=1690815 RepID=UPI000814CFCE|nr:transglycosylase domain-containing protein [Pseudonocardia sp. HH130630-07]ANY09565.1 hypothetical protein AFB00_28715 [Pseudonocardia sp. HH130630-07]